MAVIQINYTWADGSTMGVVVQGKARYPQALGDLRAEAIRAWRESLAQLGIVAEVESNELDDDLAKQIGELGNQ